MTKRTCSVEGCDRPHKGWGWCELHLRRSQTGLPLDRPMPNPHGAAIAWLRSAVLIETDDCLPWPYYCNENGYGRLRWEGRSRYAHHIALILAGRDLPVPPLEVRHTCGKGNLGCVNLRHLVNGTSAANKADRITHGTSNRGERHGMSKLTAADVLAIRSATGLHREIAARYGVSREAIGSIKRLKNWTHLVSPAIAREK